MKTILISIAAICAVSAAQVQAGEPVQISVASFNMAWAGTGADFQSHLKVCKAVSWCDTRPKRSKGAAPTPAAIAKAKQCELDIEKTAGGAAQAMMIAPCNAYKPDSASTSETAENYDIKLAGLRATVAGLIDKEGVRVIAFQEVKSVDVVRDVLGQFAARFDTCAAPHVSFQTVAYAWDRNLSSAPGVCRVQQPLAVKEDPADQSSLRVVRPGLVLELVVNGENITFMNIHLKSSCANLKDSPQFPGHKLTDNDGACRVFNRQVPKLEDWIEKVSMASPRFVLLGDFNRRIDEEAAEVIKATQVRSDGSDPSGPNIEDNLGYVTTQYLWQEISDGTPLLHQVKLTSTDASCSGFTGLDHIVISDALFSLQPQTIGSRKVGVVRAPGQKIETSDHCPRIMNLTL